MRIKERLKVGLVLGGLLVLTWVLSACAPGRMGKGSGAWQRSGSCPATRVDNHVY